jgi:hypothetical protein
MWTTGQTRITRSSRRSWRRAFLGVWLSALLGLLSQQFVSPRAGAQEGDGGRRGNGGADGGEASGETKADLNVWGKLGSPVKGVEGVFEFTYYVKDEKGKQKSMSAQVKVDEALKPWVDRRVKAEQLAEGESLYILGRQVAHEVQGGGRGGGGGGGGGGGLGGGNYGGRDRQIQNALILLAGKELEVNKKYKDPKDAEAKWLQAVVTSQKGGLWVKLSEEPHKVVLSRTATVLKRMEGDKKLLKKGVYVHVRGKKLDAPAEGEAAADGKAANGKAKDSKGEKESFEAERVVVLDPALVNTVYPALFP